MNTLALATLEALIELEIRALATICQVKSTTYKTWQPIATKWRLWVTDDTTCTEYDATFVFDLPTLPDKALMFDLDDEQPLSNGDSINLDYDGWLKDQTIRDGSNGYQVAQQLILVFYDFLHSILLPYCLDFLDRVIQIVHDTRSGIVDNHCDDEIPEYLVRWISPLTYTEDYL